MTSLPTITRSLVLTVCGVFLLYVSRAQTPADWVDPFIGTSNFGATHPGPQYPHGLASVLPFNVAFREGTDNPIEKDAGWNSRGYIHENGFLTGFSHVNLSGVGCPDLGTILLMPTTGPLELDAEQYGSTYRNEAASPGYYTCTLDAYDIKVEATSTIRTGLSRYTFPAGQSHILLNLGLSLTNETGGMVRIVSPTEIEGHRLIGTFCYNPQDVRPVYFVIRFSKPAERFGTWKKMPAFRGVEKDWVAYNDTIKPYPGYQQEMSGDNVGTYFSFTTGEGEQIEAKVGISYVSIANARENLEAEQPGFDFVDTRTKNRDAWNDLLQRAEVEGTPEQKTLFYTALYHTLIHPSILQDVNGEYPLMGKPGVGQIEEGNRYSIFSLWDTYRNVHPLLSLLYPEIQEEMVRSMVAMAKESDWLPKWELLSMETNVMVGDPATPVLADTWLRGIRGFDVETAYAAARKAALTPEATNPLRPDIDAYRELGYIPMNKEDKWGGSVSTALEYYLSDWTLGRLAEALGKEDDARLFHRRSLGYRNYLDPETGMLRPKYADASFYAEFDPEQGKNFEPVVGFVEGTAWQYRFYVPHDIPGLLKELGGRQKFVDELQACFDNDLYDVANEPDITYPFLFNYVAGEEWRSQEQVERIIKQHYTTNPGGIPGNDDTGTLSAWLVFSMMGFYPLCPADMDYALVTPQLKEVTLQLNPDYYPGDKIRIVAPREEASDRYMETANWNNKPLTRYFISHQKLVKGGTLSIDTRPTPKKN
mgnify:FL=1